MTSREINLHPGGPTPPTPKPPPALSGMAYPSAAAAAVTLTSDDADLHRPDPTSVVAAASSRLNAGAPEFVPRSANNLPHHHHHHFHHLQPRPAPVVAPVRAFAAAHFRSTRFFGGFPEQDAPPSPPSPVTDDRYGVESHVKEGLAEETVQKIVNQVEYYLGDVNLATTDHLMRFINKDPEGFVPISVIAAFKKIKSLVHSHALLADALRFSSKLVVSEDGKKVRRRQPFTDAGVEEMQSRIIVAENLPEDHSYHKLMRIFSSVGSVLSIRTCPAQPGNNGTVAASRSGKMEMIFGCNKLHAFVEYETVELAEKAVTELNDERNWRNGLRVRLLLKCMTKPARERRGQDGDGDEEDESTTEPANDKHQQDYAHENESSMDQMGEEHFNEREGGGRRGGRGRGRGRGKGRGRGQHYNNRGGYSVGTPPSSNHILDDQSVTLKQPPGPRMPDGTRGFTMGRGKTPAAKPTLPT